MTFLLGPAGYLGSGALSNSDLLEKSWIFLIGNILSPIFNPLGWDNRIVVALIFGFVAKEIIIGSLALIFTSGGNLTTLEATLATIFTPVSAFAFMAFILIYTPCIGAVFAIRKEGGNKLSIFSVTTSLILAYLFALFITFTGNLIV